MKINIFRTIIFLVKRSRIKVVNVPKGLNIIKYILFWSLSEYFPNNGGKMKKVDIAKVIVKVIIGDSIPKNNKYLGK